MGTATKILPQLDWKSKSIAWLDFESRLTSSMLSDVAFLVGRMVSGSLLLVTVCAEPWRISHEAKHSERSFRQRKLRRDVGAQRVAPEIQNLILGSWELAQAYRAIITNEIERTLGDRNASLEENKRIRYRQLFNFHYSDGLQMLTVGGLLCDERDLRLLPPSAFHGLEFVRDGEEAYTIPSPLLTWREMRFLERREGAEEWLPEEHREGYRKIYRYYPNFSEVEA